MREKKVCVVLLEENNQRRSGAIKRSYCFRTSADCSPVTGHPDVFYSSCATATCPWSLLLFIPIVVNLVTLRFLRPSKTSKQPNKGLSDISALMWCCLVIHAELVILKGKLFMEMYLLLLYCFLRLCQKKFLLLLKKIESREKTHLRTVLNQMCCSFVP